MNDIQLKSGLWEELMHSFIAPLANGDIVLAPVEGSWHFCVCADSDKLDSIVQEADCLREEPVLLVDSIKAMKGFVDLHPRIETLLNFHHKALDLYFSEFRLNSDRMSMKLDRLIVRKNCDPVWDKLLSECGRPIFIIPLKHQTDTAEVFTQLPEEIMSCVDFWIPGLSPGQFRKVPRASINNAGDLEFLP